MKKLLWYFLLLTPFLSYAGVKIDTSKKKRFLGLSLNTTLTGMANMDGVSYSQTSLYVFPEVHYGSNIRIKGNADLFIRLELTGTFTKVKYKINHPDAYLPYSILYTVDEVIIGYNPQLLYTFHHKNNTEFYTALGPAFHYIVAGLNSSQTQSSSGSLLGTTFDSIGWYTIAATTKAGYVVNKKFDIYIACTGPIGIIQPPITLYGAPYNPAATGKQVIFKAGINFPLGRK